MRLLGDGFTCPWRARPDRLEVSRDATVPGLLAWALGCAYLEQGDGRAAVATLTEGRSALVRRMAVLRETHLGAGDRRAHGVVTPVPWSSAGLTRRS